MKPIEFNGSNSRYDKSPNDTNDIGSLPVLRNQIENISCWELTDKELEEVIRTKKIWLTCLYVQPPVNLSVRTPDSVITIQN